MNRFARWLLCLVVACALCLPPRLHAQAAGTGQAHHHHAKSEPAAALPADDCHDAVPADDALAQAAGDTFPEGDSAYRACLLACASLPAQTPLPQFLWRAGACEQLRPHVSLSTPAREPEAPLRPPIGFS